MSSLTTVTHGEVITALRAYHFTYAHEVDLQEAIATVLDLEFPDVPVEREVRFESGRIDILIGRIGIEVKVAGRASSVLRQIERYAGEDAIDALVLVTNRAGHQRLPTTTLGGKPLAILGLAKAGL